VTAQTAADPEWPDSFLVPPVGPDIGTDANPIPAIVSSQFPSTTDYIALGDKFTMAVARQSLTFRLIQRGTSVSGLGDPPNFAIVPLDWVRAALPDTPLAPTVMFLRATSADAAPLTQMASAASGGIRIVSRQDAYAALHDAPLGSAVADGFGVAVGIGVFYLVLTLVGAVIISAAGRTRDLAYLRTLGVSARQALGLTTVENGPPVLLALIPGVLLGVGVALLVEPGLGLSTFVGAPGLPLFVDWPTLALVIVGLSAVVIVAILVGSWLAGRARLASTLRIGDS
jgi:putative ABC transport system permease protein